ncbi:hypothetical protein SDC9_205555 [bioreactor metagenome]|uniref:DUF2147 domain-containing protein n=1 Tax=bioreactor metagenome TaxID=1076179 RepID=A0A645J578_9ZZZZ|nr:DUF2147 domain-containing protein [Paludibacter sp.]
MKKITLLLLFSIAFSAMSFGQIDNILGKWKTIDDNDGSTKSIVYIFKATNGKYYGKIEHLFKNADKKCTECSGTNKNKPILGMMIINEMIEKNGTLTGGTILDPNNGKVYKCNISYDSATGNLNVRGSLDKGGLIGRTQTWKKN